MEVAITTPRSMATDHGFITPTAPVNPEEFATALELRTMEADLAKLGEQEKQVQYTKDLLALTHDYHAALKFLAEQTKHVTFFLRSSCLPFCSK